MEDKFLELLFDPNRWTAALEKGLDKDMPQAILRALTKKEVRAEIYQRFKDGGYTIMPPHTARIPKDNGEFRTVYVNEPVDRVVLGMINDILMEECDVMIHPACKSYQKNIGCGRIVTDISRRIMRGGHNISGWKADFSKYFDTVPIRFILKAFNDAEKIIGKSVVFDVLRRYYTSDYYFDLEGNVCCEYQSLKQGCAVASWLANVVMYSLDERLSKLNGLYVRYSDDSLFVGPDYPIAMEVMKNEVEARDMKLNPNKVEYVSDQHWFKFLGYSIKGSLISLSRNRIKTFQKEIESRTIKRRDTTFERALVSVINYLYKGYGPDSYSWASQVLKTINSQQDILTLDKFVMDCLRAVKTKKRRVGGLGYDAQGKFGCIQRGTGRNVRANKTKCPGPFEDYLTLGCMRKAMLTSKELFDTLCSQI